MKNLFYYILFLGLFLFQFSFINTGWTNCPNGSILLSTQAEVNAFPRDCETLFGDLIIEGVSENAIYDLSPLQSLKTVSGNINIINNNSITALYGLHNLESVEELNIIGNGGLVSLNGLGKLKRVTNLNIGENNQLTTLSGLEELKTISGNLYIFDNENLESIQGMEQLQQIDYVYIEKHPALLNLMGFYELERIHSGLYIADNDNLTHLYGLDFVQFGYPFELSIFNNDQLATCHIWSIWKYLVKDFCLFDGRIIYITGNKAGCMEDQDIITASASVFSMDKKHVYDWVETDSGDSIGTWCRITFEEPFFNDLRNETVVPIPEYKLASFSEVAYLDCINLSFNNCYGPTMQELPKDDAINPVRACDGNVYKNSTECIRQGVYFFSPIDCGDIIRSIKDSIILIENTTAKTKKKSRSSGRNVAQHGCFPDEAEYIIFSDADSIRSWSFQEYDFERRDCIVNISFGFQVLPTEEIPPPIASTPNSELFELYPWLNTIVDPNNCQETAITLYESRGYNYVYVETITTSILYNADGLLYCTSGPNYNCLDFYPVDAILETYSCSSGIVAPTSSRLTFKKAQIGIDNIRLYPNPFTEIIQIENLPLQSSIQIEDMNGRILPAFLAEGARQLNLSHLSSGVYFVKIYHANGVFIEKFIKH